MGYEELKGVAELAKEKDLYFVVEVTIPGQDETEFIANKPSSIDNKLAYYLGVYNEQLEHKMNNQVKIVNCMACDLSFLANEATEEDVEGVI